MAGRSRAVVEHRGLAYVRTYVRAYVLSTTSCVSPRVEVARFDPTRNLGSIIPTVHDLDLSRHTDNQFPILYTIWLMLPGGTRILCMI